MKNILLKISYDGTDFSGWQRQPGQRTVQGVLEEALSSLCREQISINGTSRTDAGVHAYGQCASFRSGIRIPVDRIKLAVNNSLPGDIRIVQAVQMPPDFHARFDAKGKKYCYKIRNCAQEDAFSRNYCYNIQKPLDISAMRQAAAGFIGSHDFKSFMAAGGTEKESTTRTIYSVKVIDDMSRTSHLPASPEDMPLNIAIEVTGDGFLYNMVRIIAGTLADVGIGKIKPTSITGIIEAKDRCKAGHTAPPQGLYLACVYFDEGFMKE